MSVKAMQKRITFSWSFFVFLMFLSIVLGMDLMLLIRAVGNSEEFGAFISMAIVFSLLIIVVVRVNLRKHKES